MKRADLFEGNEIATETINSQLINILPELCTTVVKNIPEARFRPFERWCEIRKFPVAARTYRFQEKRINQVEPCLAAVVVHDRRNSEPPAKDRDRRAQLVTQSTGRREREVIDRQSLSSLARFDEAYHSCPYSYSYFKTRIHGPLCR